MPTFVSLHLTIPAEHVAAANRLAAIFDFDTGGADTFGDWPLSPDGSEPATHFTTHTVIKPEYLAIASDPVQTMAALTQLAQARGRPLPLQADVNAWCANLIQGLPENLERVSSDQN